MKPETLKLLDGIERRNRNGDEGLNGGRVTARRDGEKVFDSRDDDGADGDHWHDANARSHRPQSIAEINPAEVYARFNKRG